MANNNKPGFKKSNLLKGGAALLGGALLGGIGGRKHSDHNESKRRENADKIEKEENTKWGSAMPFIIIFIIATICWYYLIFTKNENRRKNNHAKYVKLHNDMKKRKR